MIFRDGVKPENKELGVEFILKTPYAKKKFELFIKEYRHRNIKFSYVDEAKTRVIVSPYDLHDILCKYYFEGNLWTRDMDESFGQMNDMQYHRLIEKYFDITHSETYIASYLRVLWERDFEIVNGEYPNSHILIAAKKVRNKIKPLIGKDKETFTSL